MPTKCLFSFLATYPVVSLPIKGSNTTSFSLVEAIIILSNNFSYKSFDSISFVSKFDKEIGDAINISESRVSQLHAQAIMKLKNLLSENRTERLKRSII